MRSAAFLQASPPPLLRHTSAPAVPEAGNRGRLVIDTLLDGAERGAAEGEVASACFGACA